MDAWLEKELVDDACPAEVESRAARRLLAFSHVPPFIFKPDELDEYFNLRKELRLPLLARLCAKGCTNWFCGHYHRNAGGVYRDKEGRQLEVTTTGAVGTNIKDRPDG